MRATIYVGTSVDGFIARADGGVDFLEAGGPVEDDMGFADFMAGIDVMVMGRNTFDFVIDSGFDWPYGDTPVMVVTSRPVDLDPEVAAHIETTSLGPEELAEELERRGHTHAYVDGGMTAQSWLRAGLITDLVVTQVPVLVGDGIRLFGELDHDLQLSFESSIVHPPGYVKVHWRVVGPWPGHEASN